MTALVEKLHSSVSFSLTPFSAVLGGLSTVVQSFATGFAVARMLDSDNRLTPEARKRLGLKD